MSATIGALRESAPRETRVSLVPEVTDKLIKDGARVLIERAAGERAGFPDASYRNVAWAAVSTPSAMTPRPRLCAMAMSERTMAACWASSVMLRTKL